MCRLSVGGAARSPLASSFANFDAFGRGSFDATAANSVSGQDSLHDSPSDTMSRHSALSAFAESLKQPALMGDDSNTGSPLSDSTRAEAKSYKPSKKSHRRSTSEPVAMENWNLVEEQEL